jgi:hypothetical protein
MTRNAVRSAQAPLKERYGSEPEAALVTLSASRTLAVDRDAPVGFRAIRLRFELETDADAEGTGDAASNRRSRRTLSTLYVRNVPLDRTTHCCAQRG